MKIRLLQILLLIEFAFNVPAFMLLLILFVAFGGGDDISNRANYAVRKGLSWVVSLIMWYLILWAIL